MKTIFKVLIAFLCLNFSHAQELPLKDVKTEIKEVTVFLDGAQVTRQKRVELPKGINVLKFVSLSPFIDAKSIQASADGAITVLAVNHQQNYLNELEKSEELKDLEKKRESLNDKIVLERTHIDILTEEVRFLHDNRNIGGKNDELSVANLQQASVYFGNRLTELRMKSLEREKNLEKLNEEFRNINDQIQTITSKKQYASGEILVKVEVKSSGNFPVQLSYTVGNAGWYPSYDIRADKIDEPVQLIYKANVKQDTKVDWKNVKLKFSSADPNISGIAPELRTYFLNYNVAPPTYGLTKNNTISGVVFDDQGQPIPGANVMVEGTTIGTITDFDGKYSITVPDADSRLIFSYLGYTNKTVPVNGNAMNIALQEDTNQLEEVVVVGYGSQRSTNVTDVLQGRVAGVQIGKDKSNVKIRGAASIANTSVQVRNQTTVDFEIKTPYTINSDNKNYTVDMAYYELPVDFRYYSVPKIEREAFLIASITDWEKYNLLEGEANIFFEETYVGKTIMDVRYAKDTLEFSLGRDKQVVVTREKVRDFTTRQFIGSKKEETRSWKTVVRNNKDQEIQLMILDQIPVAMLEEIAVEVEELSKGKLDETTGEVKWLFSLKPNTAKELDLKYKVKYPKSRNLYIE
ncbi:DUF4139 domain-containing protein [Robertkochia solimangrovi]|uniref:DUF4139 domain-containing protein n=1 Tax=Robertkochia solimangrovi TaxID=2213046 RepID=UPI00117EE9A2|nr:DUF4139 domain-containing protein [Robertkochia solimangrovi]TRZ45891.1 hypothetical protein DMZ48_01040 [Robertkochia solimangrovi]